MSYITIIFRSHGDQDFIVSKVEKGVTDWRQASGDEIMEAAVRREFQPGGAYHDLDFVDPEELIADNMQHGYDIVAAFCGDVDYWIA